MSSAGQIEATYVSTIDQNSFDYTSSEGGTIQTALVLWHTNVLVDQWLLLQDIVCALLVVGMLHLVRLLAKQTLPEGGLHEEQDVDHFSLSLAVAFADEVQIYHPDAHIVAQVVQSVLELGDGQDTSCGILDYFGEQQGKGIQGHLALPSAQWFV